MMITALNLIPSGVMPVVYANQYDKYVVREFRICDGDMAWPVPTGWSISCRGTKPDGYGVVTAVSFTVGSDLIQVILTEQMTAVAGDGIYELRFAKNDQLVSTINFILRVEAASMTDSTIISDSDISYMEQVLEQIQDVQAVANQVDQNTAAIDVNAAAIAAEAAYRTAEDDVLDAAIIAEAAARASADTAAANAISDLYTEQAALSARMDTFSNLPDGSTSGDAELMDIRVEYDGKTAATAGDAVRAQVSDIHKDIRLLNKNFFDPAKTEAGKYWYAPNNKQSSGNYRAGDPIHLEAGTYWFYGISGYTWFKPDGGGDAYQVINGLVIPLRRFTLATSGTLYPSISAINFDYTKSKICNYPIDQNMAASDNSVFGDTSDTTMGQLVLLNEDLYPCQHVPYATLDSGHYYSSANGRAAGARWFCYDRFFVKAGTYYCINANLAYSWYQRDDGSTAVKLSTLTWQDDRVTIPYDGLISISATQDPPIFSNFIYPKNSPLYHGYIPGIVRHYSDVTDWEVTSFLVNNNVRADAGTTYDPDTQEYTITSDNTGASTPQFSTVSNRVMVDYDFTYSGDDPMRMYVRINRNDGTISYARYVDAETAGRYVGQFDFDAASYGVYQDAKTFQILLWGKTGTVFEVAQLQVYEAATLSDSPYYDNQLDQMLLNLSNGIEDAKNAASNITPSTIALHDAHGKKFGLVLEPDGTLSTYPYVPHKFAVFGNSISCGMIDPLLGRFGMAATSYDKDWVHYVNTAIVAKDPAATFTRIYTSPLEHSEDITTAREWIAENVATLPVDTDLVLIELGDNVNTTTKRQVFTTSCPEFLAAIRTRCPHARVVWLGIWYNNDLVKAIITAACTAYGAGWCDITSLHTQANEATEGDTVYYSDGTTGTILAAWATHPGDDGMEAIGERVVAFLEME